MQLRVQLEKLFEAMGGEKLEEDAATILHDLQNSLNAVMDDLAIQFSLRCVAALLLPARMPDFRYARILKKGEGMRFSEKEKRIFLYNSCILFCIFGIYSVLKSTMFYKPSQ